LFIPRQTNIRLPQLSSHLQQWLQSDWEAGIHNINQFLTYTRQHSSVAIATGEILKQFPSEEIFVRVSQLTENLSDWSFLPRVSRFLSKETEEELNSFLLFFYQWGNASSSFWSLDLTLSWSHRLTLAKNAFPSAITAIGFWDLHQKKLKEAMEAFTIVRSLLYGEEMYSLTLSLSQFIEAEDLDAITAFELSPIPPKPQLRPTTWQAIESFNRIIEDLRLVKSGHSQSARSLALNRIIGELKDILDTQSATLPLAEKELILNIAKTWLDIVERIAGELGTVTITKPVLNPYIIGDPVISKRFIGREDIMRQLEELWVMGNTIQSVVLYGHRRMGKTSILLNLNKHLGSGIQVIYINMQRLGTASGLGEVFIGVCDEIASALNIPPPEDESLLKLPERTFERYLKLALEKETSTKGLIIAIDEFEIIEDLIDDGKVPKTFLGYLRGLVQINPNLGFIFAGLHTLKEMASNYYEPFFASVIPISVSFLSPAATRAILSNPTEKEDFLLTYSAEALDKIYQLTHGQPYLVQLVGFNLVRFYNDYVFERQKNRDSVFTAEDVEMVINDEFFQRGRYYFDVTVQGVS
jgi:hypothetical protein